MIKIRYTNIQVTPRANVSLGYISVPDITLDAPLGQGMLPWIAAQLRREYPHAHSFTCKGQRLDGNFHPVPVSGRL